MHFVLKAALISIVAGLLAALPFAVLFTIGIDFSLIAPTAIRLLGFGIITSSLIGLPIALLVFRLIKSDQSFRRSELFLVANGTAILLAAILALAGGWFSVLFLGAPAFLAANIYAFAGWRFVLREYRDQQIE